MLQMWGCEFLIRILGLRTGGEAVEGTWILDLVWGERMDADSLGTAVKNDNENHEAFCVDDAAIKRKDGWG